MRDRIVIEGLRAFGKHGVEAREREYGQDFLIDLECRLDLSQAAKSDQLEDTLDYATIVERVRKIVETETYFLIEALAGRICTMVLADARVRSVTVEVNKPDIAAQLGLAKVGVRMKRSTK